MNFNRLINEIHNHYVNFDIKIKEGPFRGDHFGYIPEVKIYKGCINDNCNVQFILNPLNNNHITFNNYSAYFFGPEAKLQEQAWEAITSYDPKLVLSDKAKQTFNDLIDEL
jgi:hypothetical protein